MEGVDALQRGEGIEGDIVIAQLRDRIAILKKK